jgi:methyl-accepting chemotaxis protein
MNQRTYQRKQYFVHPHFQGWFIVKVTLLLLATSTISSAALYLLSEDFVATTRRAAQVGALHWWAKFAPILIGTNVAAMIVGSIVAFYVVLYASHKVVGPLIRIKYVLAEIGNGVFHRAIPLRDGDEIRETAQQILEMEGKLAQRVQAVEEAVERLDSNRDDATFAALREAVARLPRVPAPKG